MLGNLYIALGYAQEAENNIEIENSIEKYVKMIQEHRMFKNDNVIEPVYQNDYFLCPSSYISQEMHIALIQFAKNPEGEFISPWQAYTKVEWEDGEEKPEYNIIEEKNIIQDGSQGRKLEEVFHNNKPENIEKIAEELIEDIDYKTSIYVDENGAVLEEDFSAYYEKEANNKTKNKEANYRNLVATYPKNCDITILNNSRKNWRLDTKNHKINLRRLKKDRAEIEFYLPSLKQKEDKNQGYEIIALDKKGRRLEIIYDYKVPLAVRNAFNKADTDILPKAKKNLIVQIKQDEKKLWEKGEYHLIKAAGIIHRIYFKSFNGETKATASVHLNNLSSKEASIIFLSENPYYAPNVYTSTNVRNNTDIITNGEKYEVDLPAALNSLYAYVNTIRGEIVYSQDRKIIISKNDVAEKRVTLHYPLEMDIRLFDESGKDYTLSEDRKTLQFIPKALNINDNPEYYNKFDTLSYPYRVYDEKGNILKVTSASHHVDKCNYKKAVSLLGESEEEVRTIKTEMNKLEEKSLEMETIAELTLVHKKETQSLLLQVTENIKNIDQKLKQAHQQAEEAKIKALEGFENMQKLLEKLESLDEEDKMEKINETQEQFQHAKDKLALLQTKAILSRKAILKVNEELQKSNDKEIELKAQLVVLNEDLTQSKANIKQKQQKIDEVQSKLKAALEKQEKAQQAVEAASMEAESVCKVTLIAGEKISWIETALPKTYKKIELKIF